MGGRYGAETNSTATEDGDFVRGGDSSAGGGVKTYGERLDEAEFFQGERWSGKKFFGRHGDEFSESAIALHTKGLVIRAGVGAGAKAGSAVAAIGVGRQGDVGIDSQTGRKGRMCFDDGGGNFVARNSGVMDERIFAAIGIEIAAAEADHAYAEEDAAGLRDWLRDGLDGGLAWIVKDESFHGGARRKLSLPRKLENALHGKPLFAGLGLGQGLLELPHERFPFLDLGILLVGFLFGSKGKVVDHFHDHEETGVEKIDFHIEDAGIANAFEDLGPDVLVLFFVFGDESGIVFQVEGETVALRHGAPWVVGLWYMRRWRVESDEWEEERRWRLR